nr:golgin subfamily A member 5 isoform X2 [Doryrhamphus excisus]XP_057912991.1 golgin subfamily A member 5 isoform X2 [Doryrhamphus excisus]XP_057912993.1 golgin subfamily A member 5 isoform X2 [Doryrhamphus excisus]XP_057912994.1 golgin subfamily A member 5 isoform X2 [Doryrhamphus excisus]
MSWFAEFAGKAEDFLNKVDQGAATALSKNQDKTPPLTSFYEGDASGHPEYKPEAFNMSSGASHQASSYISAAAGNIKKSASAPMAASVSMSSAPSGKQASSGTSKGSSSGFVKRKKSERDVDDDMLFDFLNSSEPPVPARRDSNWESVKAPAPSQLAEAKNQTPPPTTIPSLPSTPPSTRGVSRASSLSSLSSHSMKASEESSAKQQSQVSPDSSEACTSAVAAPQESSRQESGPPEEPHGPVLSSLRLENQLLRSEVASLNQEMASVIQRSKDFQEELNHARLRADKWNAEQAQGDRALRGLRSQVDDLNEALAAKDGQLAVLKVRLDEADQLLRSRSAALEEAQKEKSRILEDHTEGSSMQSLALQSLQERLREAEQAHRREEDGFRQMQSDFSSRLSRLESERQTLAEAVTAAEKRLAEEKLRADSLHQQLRSAKAAADTAKQDLHDYKHKASRILQSKEKLISSLKEGSGLDALDGSGAAALEVEELRHEKELQREEIHKLQGQVHSLRADLQDLESQSLAEAETWREQALQLEEQQTSLSSIKQELEAEVERLKQELQYVEEEQHRVKSTLQSRVQDREDEIQKLRNQLTNKTLSSSSQTELEKRLHQLTETLIQKQTMLEALGTEKSSLVFQLERLEQQMKNSQGGPTGGGAAINMSAVEGAGTRPRNIPVLFSNQESRGMYGKVQKAASTIDRFSIRLGIFLRRYPMARVFVILYMNVCVCLFVYTGRAARVGDDCASHLLARNASRTPRRKLAANVLHIYQRKTLFFSPKYQENTTDRDMKGRLCHDPGVTINN